jgi:hypothetical protein
LKGNVALLISGACAVVTVPHSQMMLFTCIVHE